MLRLRVNWKEKRREKHHKLIDPFIFIIKTRVSSSENFHFYFYKLFMLYLLVEVLCFFYLSPSLSPFFHSLLCVQRETFYRKSALKDIFLRSFYVKVVLKHIDDVEGFRLLSFVSWNIKSESHCFTFERDSVFLCCLSTLSLARLRSLFNSLKSFVSLPSSLETSISISKISFIKIN